MEGLLYLDFGLNGVSDKAVFMGRVVHFGGGHHQIQPFYIPIQSDSLQANLANLAGISPDAAKSHKSCLGGSLWLPSHVRQITFLCLSFPAYQSDAYAIVKVILPVLFPEFLDIFRSDL